jgi:hypothetical protein
MNPFARRHFFNRLGTAALLLTLLLSLRGFAAISEGPKPQNAVEDQQRRKLLFDQAILSDQEKLRVGQARYEQRQANRAAMLQAITAQSQARQAVIGLQAASTERLPVLQPRQWVKPGLTLLLLLVVFLCVRYLYQSRKREQAAAEREKLF